MANGWFIAPLVVSLSNHASAFRLLVQSPFLAERGLGSRELRYLDECQAKASLPDRDRLLRVLLPAVARGRLVS